jgi:hypothetical protein
LASAIRERHSSPPGSRAQRPSRRDARSPARAAAIIPLAIASNYFGVWLVRVTPEALFYRISYVLVFLLGAELTRQGAWDIVSSVAAK